MNEKRYNVQAVKSWLVEYLDNEREIDNQIERIEHLTTKMVGLGAQVISDMPKAHGASTDRMADMLSQKDELEQSVLAAIESQSRTRKKIEELLHKIRNPDERAVIRMRYMDRSSWTEVRDMMFGSKDDFDEKEETYLRRTYRIHGSALVDIAKLLEQESVAE